MAKCPSILLPCVLSEKTLAAQANPFIHIRAIHFEYMMNAEFSGDLYARDHSVMASLVDDVWLKISGQFR